MIGIFFGLYVYVDEPATKGAAELTKDQWNAIKSIDPVTQQKIILLLTKFKCKQIKKAQTLQDQN
jgi:hypothetical protein